MGKFNQGIHGSFRGKVGKVVGSSWKGVEVVKALPKRKKTAATEQQAKQRAKFAKIGRLMRSMSKLLSTSYRDYAENMTGLNSAMQYNIKNALTGEYPDYGINYSKVLVSRGDLENEADAKATGGEGQVTFTWTDTTDQDSSGKPDDNAILVIYCEAQNKCIFRLRTATRKDGTATVNVPRFKGETVHTWLGFISEKEVADSRYAGAVTVS
jgi:hypothetical protein